MENGNVRPVRKPDTMLTKIAFAVVFGRMAIDTPALIAAYHPAVLAWYRDFFGWPINEYWVGSVWPIPLLLALIAAHLWRNPQTRPIESKYLAAAMLIPIAWAITLLTNANGSVWMIGDGIGHLVVVGCGIGLWLSSRKG